MDYVGKIPDINYGVEEMNASEINEFITWYEGQNYEFFDKKRVLESYCQNVFSLLRVARRVLIHEIIHIGNIDVFLESITIASACYKVLNPDTKYLIPSGGYSGNVNFYNKTIMWLVSR